MPLPGRKGVKYMALGADGLTWAWINEVEHLTWIQAAPGSSLSCSTDPPGAISS